MHTLITDIMHSIKQYTNVMTNKSGMKLHGLSLCSRKGGVIHVASLYRNQFFSLDNHEQECRK